MDLIISVPEFSNFSFSRSAVTHVRLIIEKKVLFIQWNPV